MIPRPYSSTLLALCGLILIGMGLYSALLRPALLPEDARSIGTEILLQWPTLLTLVMFPILVMMYVRLARREEREVREAFGEEYARYAATTPAFFPRPGFVRPNRA